MTIFLLFRVFLCFSWFVHIIMHPNELQMSVNISCENLKRNQCLTRPECSLRNYYQCLYSEPKTYLILRYDQAVNTLFLSNGTLSLNIGIFGYLLAGAVTSVNVSLEIPYNKYISITASHDSVNRLINCKLTPQNQSIVFPFHKALNVLIKIYFDGDTSVPIILSDTVRLVDPVLSEIGPNSTLVNHPSIFTFKFQRIATKHINTVKLILNNSSVSCNIEYKKTVNFNCQIMINSEVNWPGYVVIQVANISWYEYDFQLQPYPTINETSPSQTFPGYLVPFHFFGTNFHSFRNLKVYVSYFGEQMLLNCTIVSDTDLDCSSDRFPSNLPAVGTFIWHSHSSQLFNLTEMKFNANPPPNVTSLKHEKYENKIKIAISNYHSDYLSNTRINVVCDCQANLEFGCNQINFSALANVLSCEINSDSLIAPYDWVVILSIGTNELYIPLKVKTRYFKIYLLIPFFIGLSGSILLVFWFIFKRKNSEFKSGMSSATLKSSSSVKDFPTKVASTYRMGSYTKFPTASGGGSNMDSKSLKTPSLMSGSAKLSSYR